MQKSDATEQATLISRRLTGLNQTGSGRLALRGAMLYLIVAEGPNVGRCYPLSNGEITIGRQGGHTIVLADDRVSRNHARIAADRGQAVLTDLNSTNGSFVNDARVQGQKALNPGDRVQIGSATFQVSTSSSSELGRAAMPNAKIIRSRWHERGHSNEPVYELRSGRLYRTGWHERGPSQFADYEVRGTFVYRTAHHERGLSRLADYEIRDRCLFRTGWHDGGARNRPDYEIA
jgi:hypothetical protein